MKIVYLFAFVFSICTPNLGQSVAPDILSTTGDHFDTNNIHLQFTIGEILISNFNHSSESIQQGFHQGISGKAIATARYYSQFGMPVKLYPNPATNELFVLSRSPGRLAYSISNSLQSIIKEESFYTNTSIPIYDLAPGYYWITFRDDANRINCQPFVKLN